MRILPLVYAMSLFSQVPNASYRYPSQHYWSPDKKSLCTSFAERSIACGDYSVSRSRPDIYFDLNGDTLLDIHKHRQTMTLFLRLPFRNEREFFDSLGVSNPDTLYTVVHVKDGAQLPAQRKFEALLKNSGILQAKPVVP